MSPSSHYSIGDVLAALQPEFPDVTVSKIRFLESQGLISPERTPSGYRKFHDVDVERLRYILKQQKDNFLPLKVIKDRLGGIDPTSGSVGNASNEELAVGELFAEQQTGATISKEELASASGLAIARIDELERFGFIAARRVAGIPYYDDEAIHVAKLASAFFQQGVDSRQIRVYKNAAEREVAMFEQIVAVKLQAKNTDVRKEAITILSDLALLGGELRAAMVRKTLRELLGG